MVDAVSGLVQRPVWGVSALLLAAGDALAARFGAVAVRGDHDNPVSEGYTCPKGRAEAERINHPDRLRRSKKRVNGRLSCA